MASTPGTDLASHRACAHCRSKKVRCIPDNGNPDVCQRCARSHRPCVFTPLQKRKQRKRTDTRVAELEREMRSLRSMLKNKQEGVESQSNEAAPTAKPSGLWYEENVADAPRIGETVLSQPANERHTIIEHVLGGGQKQTGGPSLWPNRLPDRPVQESKDVIDRGILSMATARQLLDTYRNDLFPHYPTVAIPNTLSADSLRETKPTLFLAVIAAAAGKENAELSAALDQEVLQAYATRSLVQSEKSLELVQALLISAVWYHPPSKYGQLKYYEYIHMAATMAMDIGIGTRPVQHRSRFDNKAQGRDVMQRSLVHPAEDVANPDLSMAPRVRESSPDTANVESRRTFLACYMICATVSLSLRRPNMLRVSSYIRESVVYMEGSADTLPSDRILVAWVKLIMIAEEISVSFSYDDPGGIASITELRTQLMLRDFEKRLTAWLNGMPEVDLSGSLTMMYHTVRLYLHEIALHVDHSPEDFKAPYQMGVIHSSEGEEISTQVLAEAIAECIHCSHALLNTFLAMEVDSLRALPVFSYVRVSFAAFVLAKLCLSATHSGSRIGKVLDRSSLKVESYMDRAILHVREIVGPLKCRVPAIFLALLFKLRQWCLNPEMIDLPESKPAPPGTSTTSQRHTPQSEARAMMAIEEPRVTEHLSSNENSPQAPPGGRSGMWESIAGTGAINAAMQSSGSSTSGTTPQLDGTPGSDLQQQAPGVTSMSDAASLPQVDAFMGMPDQMQVDDGFLQYFGDMNGFAEGGLTGLDDWMPSDMMNLGAMPEMLDWQPTPGPTGGGAAS